MHYISNRQLRQAIKFIEMFRQTVDVKTCGIREYNDRRLAGILLRQLKAKEPIRETFSARPTSNTNTNREPAFRKKYPRGIRCMSCGLCDGLSFPDENEDKKQDI